MLKPERRSDQGQCTAALEQKTQDKNSKFFGRARKWGRGVGGSHKRILILRKKSRRLSFEPREFRWKKNWNPHTKKD